MMKKIMVRMMVVVVMMVVVLEMSDDVWMGPKQQNQTLAAHRLLPFIQPPPLKFCKRYSWCEFDLSSSFVCELYMEALSEVKLNLDFHGLTKVA